MIRQMASLKGLIPLAVLGWLLSAGRAAAQNQGYSVWANAHGSGGGSSWGSGGGWRSRRVTASAPITRSQSYYYAPAETSPVNNTVTLNLTVPADAKIWIEGSPTAVGGSLRQFVSPPIQPGHDYTYHIQVSWTQDGREVTSKREFPVHAGDVINLSFPVG